VTEPTPGHLVVSGQIARGSPPALRVWEVDNPSAFARTAFIEALKRAGVTVTAQETGVNPVALLPRKDSYRAGGPDRPARLGHAVSVREADSEGQLQPRRGPDGVPDRGQAGQQQLSDRAVCRAQERRQPRRVVHEPVPAGRRGLQRSGPHDFGGTGDIPTARRQHLLRSAVFHALPILGRDGTLANVLPKSQAGTHAGQDRQPRGWVPQPTRSSCSTAASPATPKPKTSCS